MISATDTNVPLDLVQTLDTVARSAADRQLAEARSLGPIILCDAVYAELFARFSQQGENLDRLLADLAIEIVNRRAVSFAWPGSGGDNTPLADGIRCSVRNAG